jgi:PAS domain S-box-containing protein
MQFINRAFHDAQGKLFEIQSVGRDTTERVEAETSRVRTLQLLREVLASLDEAVLVVNERTGAITECNRTAERVFGFSREELIGATIERLHESAESFGEFVKESSHQLERSDHFELEFRMKRKGGELFPAEYHGRPIRIEPELGSVIGVVRDLSERKAAERERRDLQAQLLQAQTMEAVGRLAGGVAHEFNNMLSVITGYSELAREALGPDHPVRGDVEQIGIAAGRSAALTRQLLAFARKQTVSPRPLDLGQSSVELERMMRRLVGEEVDLVIEPGPGLWPVNLDPAQLDQILANLVVNCRDAISGTGRITIGTANVALDRGFCDAHAGCRPGEYVRLTVTDDGCGMDRSTLDKLFEPFFTTKPVGQGTGLGLATVYGIVKQNHGHVYVSSELERGTTVRILFPRHQAEGRPQTAGARELADGGDETILVVEDEPEILTLCEIVLVRRGYSVLRAGSPGEAISLVEKHAGPIDLLVTDVVMPTMNGRELKEVLERRRPGLEVLYMSGYTADLIEERGILPARVHFLQKPFSPAEFVRIVRDLLDRRDRAGGAPPQVTEG